MRDYKRDYEFNDGILRIHLSGTFPKERFNDNKNIFHPITDECKKLDCKKALIDIRDIDAELSVYETYQTGINASQVANKGICFAIVMREDMNDDFFETVLRNHGTIHKVFTDLNLALD